MKIFKFLDELVKHSGSDLYLTTAAVPSVKVLGELQQLSSKKLRPGEVKEFAYEIMNPDQIREFEATSEMNLAISEKGIGRFRVNIFIQRSEVSLVIRHIKTEVPNCEQLLLPPVLKELVMMQRGLILLVGATGSGKSTTMAALINHRNHESRGHIVTIEDPIEYVYAHGQSIINQREVGVDTNSYSAALKNTLRQAPDVIFIGEIRDPETMQHAIAFSETGHLCLSTLHAANANQALERIVNFFPKEHHNRLFLDLSLNLTAFISQRLIPTVNNDRIAAFEVLIGTPLVRDMIKKGQVDELKEVMEKSDVMGMQTFDQAIYELYHSGKITLENALKFADSQNNLRLKISLSEQSNPLSSAPNLSLEQNKDDRDQFWQSPNGQRPQDSLK